MIESFVRLVTVLLNMNPSNGIREYLVILSLSHTSTFQKSYKTVLWYQRQIHKTEFFILEWAWSRAFLIVLFICLFFFLTSKPSSIFI